MQIQVVASLHAPKLWVTGVSTGRKKGGGLFWDPSCADGAAGGGAASLA